MTDDEPQRDLPVDAFDFELPERLIALRPARPRSAARLLFAHDDSIQDRTVSDLPSMLRPGDLLVFNDTKVLPVQLQGTRTRAANSVDIDVTLIERRSPNRWRAFAKPGRRLKPGDTLSFGDGLSATLDHKRDDGTCELGFGLSGAALDQAISESGAMPLPPYIASRRAVDARDLDDYQTLFASREGAVAAPTAGLHFDAPLLGALSDAGIETATITLHVGPGTFLPVKAETTRGHRMHAEWGELTPGVVESIERTRSRNGRVIAVGTTALRVLESATDTRRVTEPWQGWTRIFITPGYRFRCIDGLLTNFHLPRSTLFMLVSALMGMQRMHAIYDHAIAEGYRFYSFGDASLLLPSPTVAASRNIGTRKDL